MTRYYDERLRIGAAIALCTLSRMVICRMRTVVAGLVAALAAGCTAGPAAPHVVSRKVSHQTGSRSSAVTLAFAGDVNFSGRAARLLRDPGTAFGPIASVLRTADFSMVNLETAVTSRGKPQPKTYHFRTTPPAFAALRDAGVDLVTMANNHVLDYGRIGLADTLAAARAARFPYVGIGVNAAAAWAPYVTTVGGMRIAIIGLSQIAELEPSWVATSTRSGEANAMRLGQTLAAVRAARRLAPIVIVFMHWGTQDQPCPNPAQMSLAPRLAAAGASIIIGAHAHVLQGSGWLDHTFVAYGMGNFLFGGLSFTNATGILELTLRPHARLTARFLPAVVARTDQPRILRGARARRAAAQYARLRACTGLTARPSSR
jgi:poly-gamma-glutamate synthesis protein (capsule biosynthesis protein)